MTRLNAAVRWDFRLQFRNGFYYAAAFVALFIIVILAQFRLSQEVLAIILPVVLLQNVTINAFYFMAGLVLLEKGEGILEGIVVSPMRNGEYLGSKLVTLTLLSIVENSLIVLVLYGLQVNLLVLLASLILMSIFLALIGFIAVIRYNSINSFLFPSFLMLLVLSIPLLDYFGIWQTPLMYLHPTQALLVLLKAIFQPVENWQIIYGLLYSLAWIAVAYQMSKPAFHRFVILKEGTYSNQKKATKPHVDIPAGDAALPQPKSTKQHYRKLNIIGVLKALGPIDLRNVRRDSLLLWMAAMPLFLALLFRFVVPWVRDGILQQFDFDIQPYYPLLMSYGFIIATPLLFGVVIGFLLLDERDDQTLKALQVTPLPLSGYLAYRTILPMILSVVLTVLMYPIAGLVPFSTIHLIVVSLLAAPLAPIFALFMATFAANKVQGFALMKGMGVVLILPLLAFFIESNWQILLGVVPTYWSIKLYWVLYAGESGGWIFFVAGIIYQLLILVLLLRRFNAIMHR